MVTLMLWSGVVVWAVVGVALAMVLWGWFIWPAVETVSITRAMYVAGYHDSVVERWWRWYKQFVFGGDAGLREISGAKPDAKHWNWQGVGKWQVW